MRTQLTEFPLCAEWTFDEEGLEGKNWLHTGAAAALSLWSP